MTTREEKLLIAKERLCTALGEPNTKTYMAQLKMWFRKACTKEQFDIECRKLLASEHRHLHNEFFVAILNKISTPWHTPGENMDIETPSSPNKLDGSAIKKRKKYVKPLLIDRPTFEPVELYDFLPEEDPDLKQPSTPLPQPRYAAQELFLPDTGLILGRLLISAWENGIANTDDLVCDIIVIAVQMFLKNILTSVLTGRKHYRVTNNTNFIYDIGHCIQDPFIRNTVSRHVIDDNPFDIDKEISTTSLMRRVNDDSIFLAACENSFQLPTASRITILDVYNVLQDKSVIPSHSVQANNVERISQLLN